MNNSSINGDIIYEFNTFYNNDIKPLLEGPILTGIAGVGLATMILGKDRIISMVSEAIEIVKKIIAFVLDSVRKLWKWFTINGRDIYKSNKAFLSKYESKLSEVLNKDILINGYAMDKDISTIINNLTAESRLGSNNINIISIVIGEDFKLKTKEDVDFYVNQNRDDILDFSVIGSRTKNKNLYNSTIDFKNAMINSLYGPQHLVSHSVNSALNVIKDYEVRIVMLKDTKNFIEEYGKRDIENLDRLKFKIMNGRYISSHYKPEITNQFNYFVEYKQRTLADFILAFEVLTKYVNDMNIQAKSICIRALQDD